MFSSIKRPGQPGAPWPGLDTTRLGNALTTGALTEEAAPKGHGEPAFRDVVLKTLENLALGQNADPTNTREFWITARKTPEALLLGLVMIRSDRSVSNLRALETM